MAPIPISRAPRGEQHVGEERLGGLRVVGVDDRVRTGDQRVAPNRRSA